MQQVSIKRGWCNDLKDLHPRLCDSIKQVQTESGELRIIPLTRSVELLRGGGMKPRSLRAHDRRRSSRARARFLSLVMAAGPFSRSTVPLSTSCMRRLISPRHFGLDVDRIILAIQALEERSCCLGAIGRR